MQNKQSELDLFNVISKDGYNAQTKEHFNRIFDSLLSLPPSNPFVTSEQSKYYSVLECGCGTGAFAKFFLNCGCFFNVIGVDIAPAMIKFNNDHKVENYSSICGDLENKELFPPESFDVILCPMVLHHFQDPSLVFQNSSYWIKKDGIIVIFEPNGSSPVNKFSKFIRHILEKIFGTETTVKKWRLATINETDHSLKKYKELLSNNNFSVLKSETIFLKKNKYTFTDFIDIRNLLYFLCNIFPQPIKGNVILLVGKKN